MGESIYKFARREIPGAFAEAWAIEKDRLARRNRSVWHINNQILQSYALTVVLTIGMIATLGWAHAALSADPQCIRLLATHQR